MNGARRSVLSGAIRRRAAAAGAIGIRAAAAGAIRRNPVRSNVFKGAMATDSRPITAAADPPRRAWRRAANVAATVALVVASVAAQAADLTPIAIVLLVAAVCALAPLFSPAIDA
jgi:hypothetical protein